MPKIELVSFSLGLSAKQKLDIATSVIQEAPQGTDIILFSDSTLDRSEDVKKLATSIGTSHPAIILEVDSREYVVQNGVARNLCCTQKFSNKQSLARCDVSKV